MRRNSSSFILTFKMVYSIASRYKVQCWLKNKGEGNMKFYKQLEYKIRMQMTIAYFTQQYILPLLMEVFYHIYLQVCLPASWLFGLVKVQHFKIEDLNNELVLRVFSKLHYVFFREIVKLLENSVFGKNIFIFQRDDQWSSLPSLRSGMSNIE